MDSRLVLAGAGVAAIAICAVAVAALSLSQGSGQTSTSVLPATPALTPTPSLAIGHPVCSVFGSVISSRSSPIPGVNVTLHVMGDRVTDGKVTGPVELYAMATTTEKLPQPGSFRFENVTLPAESRYAYVTAAISDGNVTYYGASDNATLVNNTVKSMYVVMHLPPALEGSLINGM